MNQRGRNNEPIESGVLAVVVPERGHDGARPPSASQPWRVYLLRRDGDRYSIAAERVASAGDVSVAAWAQPYSPSRVLVVLPASATICRTCGLPPTEGEQLMSALRLQAETALLGGVPSHRIGIAALPHTLSGKSIVSGRQGVIVAWPESATIPEVPPLPCGGPAGCDVRYVPSVAALLALLGGHAPATPLICANRDDGTLVLIVATANELLIRSTREDASEPDVWREGIRRAAAETLLAADRSAAEVRELHDTIAPQLQGATDGSFLLLPTSATQTMSTSLAGGRTGDADRDNSRALALGAALATSGPLASLAGMRDSLPTPPLSPVERVSRWIAAPRNTMLVVFVAVLVFLLGPLAFAGVRYGVLRLKLPDPRAVEKRNAEISEQVQVYKQLQRDAWPMTKLLGDLANCLPEGIEVEMLQIGYGEGVTLRGAAKPYESKTPGGATLKRTATDELIRMENLLRSTKIFTGTQSKWEDETAHGYRGFQVNFNVVNPTHVVGWDKDTDFGAWSFRDRKFPDWREIEQGSAAADAGAEEATSEPLRVAEGSTEGEPTATQGSPDDGAMAAANSAEATDAPARPTEATPDDPEGREGAGTYQPRPGLGDRGVNRSPRTGGDPGESGGARGPSQPVSAPPVEIPPPVTDAELNALSKSEAQALLGKVSRARQLPNVDEETKQRLREDFQKVLNYVKSLPS